MLSIHDRPFDPANRSEPGHWEGDVIVGSKHGSAIGTLVERQTRTIRLLHLPVHDSQTTRGVPGKADARSPCVVAALDHLGSGHRVGPGTTRSPPRSGFRSTSATRARPSAAFGVLAPLGGSLMGLVLPGLKKG
jgi:hypothetical protein